jgi:hypothetical protein
MVLFKVFIRVGCVIFFKSKTTSISIGNRTMHFRSVNDKLTSASNSRKAANGESQAVLVAN